MDILDPVFQLTAHYSKQPYIPWNSQDRDNEYWPEKPSSISKRVGAGGGGSNCRGVQELAAHRESFELPQVSGIPPQKSSRALSQGKTLLKTSSTWLGVYVSVPWVPHRTDSGA